MATKPSGKPSRILVLDDEGDILEVLKLLLEYEGHHVVAAKDGRAALAATAARPFDLVVMDISMPDMSGIDIARTLRGNPKTADIRIAFHTGLDEHWVRERFADYDLYLTKANDAQVLVDEIARLLAEARPARGATGDAAAAEVVYSSDEAMRAQRALRSAMGLGPVALTAAALLAGLDDEIAQLHRIGRSDAEIAELIAAATGKSLPASAVTLHRKAPQSDRDRGRKA